MASLFLKYRTTSLPKHIPNKVIRIFTSMKKLKPLLNTLTFVFSLYPTLLPYPIFLGIFIDYDLFDSRCLAISLV